MVKFSLSAFFSGNLALTIFTSIVIFYLWGMINGLQLIAMTCLFRIRLPANVSSIMNEILKLANFDLLRTGWIIDKVFRFSETPSFSASFEQADFEGSNFIQGIGPMFIAMVYYAGFLCVRWVVIEWLYEVPCMKQRIVPWFRSHNIEATSIRFILEGNIDILFWTLISALHVKDSHSLGPKAQDRFSNLFGFAMLMVLAYAPFHAIYRAIQYHKLKSTPFSQMSDEEREAHVKQVQSMRELFKGVKLNRPSLLYSLIFIVRRMVMVATLIFLPLDGNFQVFIYLGSAFWMLIYAISVKPYEDRVLNRQEVTNELFILLTGYFMLMFSGWIPDEEKIAGLELNTKTAIGLAMLCSVLLNVMVNIGIVLVSLGQEIKRKWRIRRMR